MASGSSWLLVAPNEWPREQTRVIMADSGLRQRSTAILLSWSTSVFVVPLTIKVANTVFHLSFSYFNLGIDTLYRRAPSLQPPLLKHNDISDRMTSWT